MWGFLEYRGGCSVLWAYHEYCGVILSTVGVFSTVGGYHDAHGGYDEYSGGVHYRGRKNLLLFEYPTVLNTPKCTFKILEGGGKPSP